MQYYVVIPAHNEQEYLGGLLDSILEQTILPQKVIVVNDNSTDNTENIIDTYTKKSSFIQKLNTKSSIEHMPGSKVITAFNKGLELLDDQYDFLVKLDADLILPPDYFETLSSHFKSNPDIGIAGGYIYEQNHKGDWELNHPMDKDHVRGAFKAYSKACFKAIGGLKTAMGWDTVDELLARYHGFALCTDPNLKVKHLRPTGIAYNKRAKKLQGSAMYSMRYGFWISCIASLKMAYHQKSFASFFNNLSGYLEANQKHRPYLVNPKEGAFIRKLRWQNIKRKLFH